MYGCANVVWPVLASCSDAALGQIMRCVYLYSLVHTRESFCQRDSIEEINEIGSISISAAFRVTTHTKFCAICNLTRWCNRRSSSKSISVKILNVLKSQSHQRSSCICSSVRAKDVSRFNKSYYQNQAPTWCWCFNITLFTLVCHVGSEGVNEDNIPQEGQTRLASSQCIRTNSINRCFVTFSM